MRRMSLVIAGVLLAVLVPTAAWAGYSGPTRALPNDCAGSRTVTGSDGVTRGWVRCDGQLEYVQGTTGMFVRHSVPYDGSILAVTDDGTATYLVLSNKRNLRLIKRLHSGTATSTRLSRRGGVDDAAVTARKGTWWAVWSEVNRNGAPGATNIFQAKTHGGVQVRKRIFKDTVRWNREFALALRPHGGAVLAWRHESTASTGQLYVGINKGAGWQFSAHAKNGNAPVLVRDGDTVRLGFVNGARKKCNDGDFCHVVYQPYRGGHWRKRHTFAHSLALPATSDVVLAGAVSDGHVFLGWTSMRSDGTTTKGIVAEHTPGHGWSEGNVSGGGADEELTGLGGVNGAGRVILVHSTSTTKYDVVRHE